MTRRGSQSGHKSVLLPVIALLLVALPLIRAQSAKEQVRTQVAFTLRKVAEACREQTGASESDFEAMVSKEPATTMQAKCLRACLMKKFGLMDNNGKFNKDVPMQVARDHIAADELEKMRIAEEIVTICHNLPVSKNHCEAADQYGKCASDHVAARGLRLQGV